MIIDFGLLLPAICLALIVSALCAGAIAYFFWRNTKLLEAFIASMLQARKDINGATRDLGMLNDDLDGLVEDLQESVNLLACTASKRQGKLRVVRPAADQGEEPV